MYASPTWLGMLSGAEHDRLKRFIRRVVPAVFLQLDDLTTDNIAELADDALFRTVIYDG